MIRGPCGTDNPSSPCGTSPQRTLHQVYELLLIEMESAYSYSASLPRNARYVHQVYELLLIEMESAYSHSESLSHNALFHRVYVLLLIEIELIHRNLNIPNNESYIQI